MTKARYYNGRLDMLLRMFLDCRGGRVGWDALLDVGSKEEDWLPAIDFLVREGYLEKHAHDVEITYKGKSFIEQGGFVGQHRRERLLLYCGAVAALCGFCSLLLSVVALLR